MKYLIPVLFLYSISALSCENHEVLAWDSVDGKSFALIVPVTKIVEAPRWGPSLESPPISMKEAKILFNDWANKNLSEYEVINLNSIEAKKYSCWLGDKARYLNEGEFWFYILTYKAFTFEPRKLKTGTSLVLLMSGEIIEPVEQ